MNTTTKTIHAILRTLSGSVFFTYLLLWLVVLLALGTVTQQWLGLFLAQEKYFFSWMFLFSMGWVWLPLPSGMTTLALMTVSLAIKMFYRQKTWQKRKLGTIIAHLASLGLLVGGFVVALVSQHGNMAVAEGSRSNMIADPYRTELALIDAAGRTLWIAPERYLHSGRGFELPEISATLMIEDYFVNSQVSRRAEPMSKNHTRGMLMNIDLTASPRNPKEEENFAGLIFKLEQNTETKRLGIFEMMPIAQTVTHNDETYTLELRRAQATLPFEIELVDFVQEFYPGTTNARGYSSRVILHDDGAAWPALIAMNEPLRYKGFTLYQASFVDAQVADRSGGELTPEVSIFAVVENRARLLPYITSFILCLGLLIHLFIRLPKLHPNLMRKRT